MSNKWSDSEVAIIESFGHLGPDECLKYLQGRSRESIRKKIAEVAKGFVPGSSLIVTPTDTSEIDVPGATFTLKEDAIHPATRDTRDNYISELESELSTVKAQLTWAQHAESDIRVGGTITHRESDCHYADSNHLLSSCESAWAKALVVFKQYAPSKIQLIWGDDYVAGRGIYKNQDLDVTASNAEQQCEVGAVHFIRRIKSLRSISNAPIRVFWLRGNHEYSNGHPLASSLFLMVKNICECEGIKDIEFTLCLDKAVINLAHDGIHNGLFTHGYGHSEISPNSPRFIHDMLVTLLIMHRNLQPVEQIHRVASGHTHQLSVDFERTIGIKWDTTGGWQRNARVQLGFNQRPSGTIMYVSLPGMDGEILSPITIQPEERIYTREIEDSYLPARNLADTSECLIEYNKIMQGSNLVTPSGIAGTLSSGRW